MMKRLFPSPLLSGSLFVLWLVLNHSVSPGHLLLGAIVGILAPWLMSPLRPTSASPRRPLVLARLIMHVGADVVLSALQLTRGVMGFELKSAFVVIPLEIRDANAIASLAMITTVVPGTVWTELAPDRSSLMLHVFELDDSDAYVRYFKARYEQPLKLIFEGGRRP